MNCFVNFCMKIIFLNYCVCVWLDYFYKKGYLIFYNFKKLKKKQVSRRLAIMEVDLERTEDRAEAAES